MNTEATEECQIPGQLELLVVMGCVDVGAGNWTLVLGGAWEGGGEKSVPITEQPLLTHL